MPKLETWFLAVGTARVVFMSNGSELKSPGAQALRKAGFVPLPRLWVKAADLAVIKQYAERYEDEVNAIRKEANT